MESIAVLCDVCKNYDLGKENSVQVLKNINLTFECGKTYAVTGASGSGKTTLLNILGKLSNPSSGTYYFEGEDISQYNDSRAAKFRNKSVGFVVQDFALIEEKTAKENIVLPLLFTPKGTSGFEQRLDYLLNRLNIVNIKNKKVQYLSGGQKQRVAIARALINSPKMILADEPTGAIDSKTAEDVMNLFFTMKDEKTTIIIATHNLSVAQKCDHIIHISDGVIKMD